jgi:hypothetical protein
MDYAGMNEGYRQFIGCMENPNLAARGTVQVVACGLNSWPVTSSAHAVAMWPKDIALAPYSRHPRRQRLWA